jgi:hypothetical protein
MHLSIALPPGWPNERCDLHVFSAVLHPSLVTQRRALESPFDGFLPLSLVDFCCQDSMLVLTM